MKKIALSVFGLIIFSCLVVAPVTLYAQDSSKPHDLGWVLGDVVDLDLEANRIIVSYIDYSTNQNKQVVIYINNETKYTNISSIKDLKINDVVAVDYKTTQSGEGIALNITAENFE